MRSFHSKVGWWYWGIIALLSIGLFWTFWVHLLLVALVFAVVLILVIDLLIHTQYIITEDGRLCIEGGRFLKSKCFIEMSQILQVKRSASMEASPALSLHRLKIIYRKGKLKTYVLLSPQNEGMFVRALLKWNESIVVQI